MPQGIAWPPVLWSITLVIISIAFLGRAARSADLVPATVASHSPDVSLSWLQLFAALGVGTVAASVIGWWSSKGVAISNNRQAWINALRDDIATYLKESDLMHYRMGKILSGPAKTDHLDEQQEARANTLLLYRRIRMRLNMTETPSRKLADALDALQTVGSQVENEERMEAAILASGVVLKREWAVTKYGMFTPLLTLFKGGQVEADSSSVELECLRRRLNVAGLVLGIVGVVCIWIWGPPQPSFERGVGIAVGPKTVLPDGRTADQHDTEKAVQEAHYRRMSQLGLGLILVGFICQLGSECIPRDGGFGGDSNGEKS